jgi:uncharacterized protein YwgA
MQEVTLNFFQRFKLVDMIGVQEGRAAELRLAYKIIDKVDFTEEERNAAAFSIDPKTGNVTWRLPDAAFATKVVQLEDTEAERVKTVLESWPRSKPAFDRSVIEILDQLAQKS